MAMTQHRPAHRPLRAHDARRRPARRHGAPPLRVRAVRPPPVRRPPLRRRRRHRAPARRSSDDFRFGDDELRFLRDERVVDAATLDFLAGYRFTGSITGYREGELYFPGSPILTIEGTFAEAVVLETLALSVLNHDSAVATAAARMSIAAGDRPLAEMGSRRAGEAVRRRRGARRLHRRIRRHQQPRGGPALGHPDDGHRRARVDAAARHRGGRVPLADRRARRRHDAARRHLRHPRRASRRPSGSPAPASAASASTPATCRPSPPRCARSSTSSARPARRSP